MEIRKICQWCGKPFIAQKTTTCYCSHQCSNLGYKERIRERKRQLKRSQELLQPRQAAEGQDFFSFAQAAKLMGVTRQYIYKLVKESKLRASRLSGKKYLESSNSGALSHFLPKVAICSIPYLDKNHLTEMFSNRLSKKFT